MKYKGRVVFATGVVLAITATLGATSAGPASAAGNTLVVNAGSVLRPVTHVAAGALYGLSSEIKPGGSQLDPLHLNEFTQPPANSLQAGGVGSVPNIKNTMIGAGAQTYERMVDIYPDAPYKWVSWDDWTSKVTTMVNARLADTSLTNVNGWELWNEPDGTWNTSAAGAFNDGWTRTYNLVRSLDSITPIVGPSTSSYNHSWMLSFLTAAKAAATVPDVISWHLWNADSLPSELTDLRSIESSLGISPRPVSINEYAWPNQVDVPSASLHYIATFERATDVRDADRAFWFEAGTIDGLLYNGAPTGTYWLYKWYGDMAGKMVSVAQNGAQDGIASLDSTQKILTAVVGGATGTNSVQVNNIGSFGSSVTATVYYTPNSGRLQNDTAPTLISTGDVTVSGGSATVTIPNQDPASAYEVVLTPLGGPTTSYQQTYETENATVVNSIRYSSATASNGGYVGQIDGTGDARSDSFIDFIVNAPTTGTYNMSIKYANGGTSPSTQGLAYNGGAFTTVSYPATAGWGQFATVNGPTLSLNAGYNMIRLAKGSPGYAGGAGYAELDSITITSQSTVPTPTPLTNPAAASYVNRVEAESATVTDGTISTAANASNGSYVSGLNNADSAVAFNFNAPAAGSYKLNIGYANGAGNTQNGNEEADVQLSVNGTNSTVMLPVTGAWGGNGGIFGTATLTVALAQGANTVTITHLANQNYAELDYAQISSPATAIVK